MHVTYSDKLKAYMRRKGHSTIAIEMHSGCS